MSRKSRAVQNNLKGQVRLDESVSRLVARLKPGDVAVIEAPDLDRRQALALLGARPTAVLNVSASTTGRRASLGALLLVESGIPVVDDLGGDVMTLAEGASVQVRGAAVYENDVLIATGVRRELEELRSLRAEGRERLKPSVETFAHTAGAIWETESAQILTGEGLQSLSVLAGRTVMVVSDGLSSAAQLKALKEFRRDFSVFIIAEGPAADLVSKVARDPDLIIGDISTTSEKLLRKGIPLVLLERPDGQVTGGERASVLGLDFVTVVTEATAADAAVLLADVSDASQIILVRDGSGLDGFLELSGPEAAAGFFITVRAQNKIIFAPVANELYRPGVRTWQLVLLLIAALIVLAAAILFTPWAGTWGHWLWGEVSSSAESLPAPIQNIQIALL